MMTSFFGRLGPVKDIISCHLSPIISGPQERPRLCDGHLSSGKPRKIERRGEATCTWHSWPRPPWPSAQPRSPSRSNSGTGDVNYITHKVSRSSSSDAVMERSDWCKDSGWSGDTIWEWWHNARPGAHWSPHLRPSLTSGHLISIFIFKLFIWESTAAIQTICNLAPPYTAYFYRKITPIPCNSFLFKFCIMQPFCSHQVAKRRMTN